METTPGLRRPVPDVCRILCCNVWGLAGNLSDLTVASSQYDILLCGDFGLRYASHVGIAGSRFWTPCLVVSGQDAYGPWDGAYVRDEYGVFRKPKFECGCEMLVFRVCGVRQNLYVYSLYRNPDLDDRIFDCLLASMAAVQAEDVRASFLFGVI